MRPANSKGNGESRMSEVKTFTGRIKRGAKVSQDKDYVWPLQECHVDLIFNVTIYDDKPDVCVCSAPCYGEMPGYFGTGKVRTTINNINFVTV